MITFTFAIFVSTFIITDVSGELKVESAFFTKFFLVLALVAAADCGCSLFAAAFEDRLFCRCCCSVASTWLLLFVSDCFGNHFTFVPPCFQVFRNALNSCSAHYFTLFSSFNRY